MAYRQDYRLASERIGQARTSRSGGSRATDLPLLETRVGTGKAAGATRR